MSGARALLSRLGHAIGVCQLQIRVKMYRLTGLSKLTVPRNP